MNSPKTADDPLKARCDLAVTDERDVGALRSQLSLKRTQLLTQITRMLGDKKV